MNKRNGADTFADKNSPNNAFVSVSKVVKLRGKPPTIESTIIESNGKGVTYASPEVWTTLGIGGLSTFGDDTPSAPGSPSLHLAAKLGRRMLFPNEFDILPSVLRIADLNDEESTGVDLILGYRSWRDSNNKRRAVLFYRADVRVDFDHVRDQLLDFLSSLFVMNSQPGTWGRRAWLISQSDADRANALAKEAAKAFSEESGPPTCQAADGSHTILVVKTGEKLADTHTLKQDITPSFSANLITIIVYSTKILHEETVTMHG
uniref:Uncharacterized protein n=1 Tax=Moniliophthora roreri TaxID=221103 RepID=A0A0W0EX69_MONRR